MVVPPCLRSPANSSISFLRLTAARRSISTRNVSLKSSLNLGRGRGGNKNNFTGINETITKFDSAGSIRVNYYSTSPATAATLNPLVEDESIVEVINGEGHKSSTNSIASNSTSASNVQYSEASDRAWSTFQSLKAQGPVSSSDFINTLRQLSEARDFTRCKLIFDEIKTAGIELDSEMFSLILNAGRRTLRSNEIRELFGDRNEYLQRRSQNGRENNSSDDHNGSRSVFFEQMSNLMNDMKSANLRPSVWFYEELANFLTAINQAGVLINLATAMEKRGEQPSPKFYNRMLHCLPRCGLLDRASMLFNRMVLRGNADYYTYLVRASSLVYVNQMEAARAVLSDMKGKFPMDAIAFNILIKSYLSQGNCDQALQVFKQMTLDPSIAPNRITCRTFLSHFYETGNLANSEPIVSHFEKANFPETFEDFGNVIKFFARYDPPKVMDIFTQLKNKLSAENTSKHEKNQVYHAFLRVLNDRQVTNDWKKTFADLILETESLNTPHNSTSSGLNSPDLPFHFKMIIDRIESPDSVTYEIVLKKLIQLRRYDSVKALYQSMFSSENPHNVSAQPVHRNLYLTALLMSRETNSANEFINEMHGRRIPISGKNTLLLEEAGIELPRGALTAKKGQGVTAIRNFNNNQSNRPKRNESNESTSDHEINLI